LIQGDWDGDGITDFGRLKQNAVRLRNHNPVESSRIYSISEGLGKVTQISYARLSDGVVYAKDTTAVYPQVDLQTATYVVSNVATSNGIGNYSSRSYNYAGLKFDFEIRSIAGFRQISVSDTETGLVTSTHYKQTFPFIGVPYLSEVRLSNGTLVSKKEDTWTSITTNPGVVFPYASLNVESSYELSGNLISSSITQNTFDSWGNVLTRTTSRSDGSSETTVSTYDNDVGNWLIGQLRSTTVTKVGSGSPAPAAVTKRVAFNYLPGTGLLQSEVVEPGHPLLELRKSYQYDSFGNITQKTVTGIGIQPRIETTAYDNRGQFVVSTTNPLGQTETKTTDPRFGKVTSLTGPNGITTTWQYDSFGRVTLEQRADGTVTNTYYEQPGALAPANAALKVRVSTTGLPAVITYADELTREIRKESTGFSGQKIYVDKVYDTKGNLTHVSDPYFEGSTPAWTVSEYDDLGRVIRVTQPGNRVSSTLYNGLTTTSTNALNQTTTQVTDVQGFVLSSTDATGQTLTFKNDSYGNPTQIMDPLLNTTFIEYDHQGKKTKLVDPDTGESTYTYNALGELLSETNALNQTTTYSYDLLGRMLQRSSLDGVESWQYDTALNGIGKLARVTGLKGYVESYEYDSLGRLYRTSTTVGGKTFVSSQTYDALSRVDTYSYPSAFTIKNIYNSHGYLSEIKRTDLNTSIWKINQLSAKGQLEQQTFGNGLVSNKIYDANTGYLTAVQTNGVQNLSFSYDALGNLLERQDLGAGLRENFTYDTLNRLKTATILGRPPISVQYDEIGNLISRSDVGTYVYGVGAGPHAVTSISGNKANTYVYDAAGNRVSSSDGNISYSVSGKPVSITKGSSKVEFDLNPADQRVEERVYLNNSLTERKTYVGGLYESSVKGLTTTSTHYIKGSDGLVALVTTSSTQVLMLSTNTSSPAGAQARSNTRIRYLHLDHLGSIQSISDAAGRVIEVLSYDAWGQRRDADTWDSSTVVSSVTDRGFTGHEHLDEVSLVHMNGRVYDPVIGRFVSADPFIQAPKDLQSYNRYSYVLNNPLSLTDPSGYFSFKKFWKKALNTSKTLIKTAVVTGFTLLGSSFGGPIGASFMSSFSSTLIYGGNIHDAFHRGLRNIPKGVLRASIDFGVGEFTEGMSIYANALSHAVVDGTYAAVNGDSFASGFASGGFGALGGNYGGPYGTFVAALSGGTGAALSGGKFEEGAMRGAFIYLYNHEQHKKDGERGSAKSGQEALKSSLGALMSVAFDRTAELVGGGWKVPTVSGFSSYGLSAFGIAEGLIAVGADPANQRAQLDLTMAIFGVLPVVSNLSLGYDIGKAAAYGLDALGAFDYWVAQDFRNSNHAKDMSGAYSCAKIGAC
jgi:RHS repeat-associated protein